jgi:DNA-binding transcriptional regulator GbsR (MarR family)
VPELNPVARKFVLHWGELGARWGINRTVAQVHALLFVSERPLNAEQIQELLGVARSNVSTSLRELQGWGIVRVVHVMGDRRDYFESMQDVWELFRQVLEERKRREVDPAMAMLRECVAESRKGGAAEAHARQKLTELLNFFETTTAWYEQLRKMPTNALMKFVSLGDKVRKALGG